MAEDKLRERAIFAARTANLAELEECLDTFGLDIESRDNQGNTLFCLVVQQNEKTVAKYLLRRGALGVPSCCGVSNGLVSIRRAVGGFFFEFEAVFDGKWRRLGHQRDELQGQRALALRVRVWLRRARRVPAEQGRTDALLINEAGHTALMDREFKMDRPGVVGVDWRRLCLVSHSCAGEWCLASTLLRAVSDSQARGPRGARVTFRPLQTASTAAVVTGLVPDACARGRTGPVAVRRVQKTRRFQSFRDVQPPRRQRKRVASQPQHARTSPQSPHRQLCRQ